MTGDAERDSTGGGIDPRFRIINWIGIIDQLAVTKANRVLATHELPWPQFVMLNHFSHRPDEAKTVMGIAGALQQNQPAVSKTVRAMREAGLLSVAPAPGDGRSRLIYLTTAGRARHRAAVDSLMPLIAEAFADWDAAEIDRLFADLDRLKRWFDENR